MNNPDVTSQNARFNAGKFRNVMLKTSLHSAQVTLNKVKQTNSLARDKKTFPYKR
jgi:hypothetical protein